MSVSWKATGYSACVSVPATPTASRLIQSLVELSFLRPVQRTLSVCGPLDSQTLDQTSLRKA